MSDRRVVEIHRLGDEYRVVLVPPDALHPDETFANKRAAFGHAGGVRMVTGRRKIDLTGE